MAEIIRYRYADRVDDGVFTRSPYDCEAAFSYGDSLYLLTKDWKTLHSTLYTCSKKPGTYELKARRRYDVDGLVTGADFSSDPDFLVLCGYRDYVPFIILFSGYDPLSYSPGAMLRFDFPAYPELQTEGISILSPERVFISCEMTRFPAALYRINLLDYLN
jgi:hypothetical protein